MFACAAAFCNSKVDARNGNSGVVFGWPQVRLTPLSSSPIAAAQPTRQRLGWVDLFRGLAVVGMIWVHSVNALLAPAIRLSPPFSGMIFYFGLVAPSFLWVAGYMRGRSSLRTEPRKNPWPTARRLTLILFLGLLTHLPWSQFAKGDFSTEALRIASRPDILYCLAISCGLLLAIEQGPRRLHAPFVAGLFLLVTLIEPVAAQWQTGFIPLDALLSRKDNALAQFPLLPWVGFAAAGFLAAHFAIHGWRFAATGAALAFGSPWLSWPHPSFWFTMERLGWVMFAAAVCAVVCNRWPNLHLGWIRLAGRESLVAYVGHLVLLFAVPLPPKWLPLSNQPGASLSVASLVFCYVTVLSLTLLIAKASEWRKCRSLG